MFEKLTPRERKLAYGVLGLLPAALIFVAIFWFIGEYSTNDQKAMSLITKIKAERELMKQALKANRRRQYMNSISVPANLTVASNEYQVWLKLLLSELNMELKSIQPRDAGSLKAKESKKEIGQRKIFALTTKGDLDQLTQFLDRFYSLELLHRINTLKITPENEIGANDQRIRNGKLSLSMTIEVLSLDDADPRHEFTNNFKELARSSKEYQEAIVKRNIFGPANNIPTVSVRPSSSYYTDRDARISVSAKDADKNNLLGFELVDSSIEGAELVQSKPSDRRAVLNIPAPEPGKYEFKVRVFDDGFPSKENFDTFVVTFKDKPKPPEKKAEPEPEPKPKYRIAKQTYINSFVNGLDGEWEVWINARLIGQKFRLKVGETFDLEEEKWVVRKIDFDYAVLEFDGKQMTFFEGDNLDSPRKTVAINPPKAVVVNQTDQSEVKTEEPANPVEDLATTKEGESDETIPVESESDSKVQTVTSKSVESESVKETEQSSKKDEASGG